jgi:hypothetical protein
MKNFSFSVFLFSGSVGCQIAIDQADHGDDIDQVKNCQLLYDDCEDDPNLYSCSDLSAQRFFLTRDSGTITYVTDDFDSAFCECYPSLC